MIDVTITPRNREHFGRLVPFAGEVLDACHADGIEPIPDASLAVFAYTQSSTMEVRDVDFSCSESEFPGLCQALRKRRIGCEIRPWQVLQARQDGLKAEFGAVEHWNRGIPDDHERVRIGGIQFQLIGLDGLREQHLRGIENTADGAADRDPPKHQRIAAKLRLLVSLNTRSS